MAPRLAPAPRAVRLRVRHAALQPLARGGSLLRLARDGRGHREAALLYVTVGMTALMLMLPLAATSTVAAIRRLGGKNWQRLHRLAYAVGVAGVLHYLWRAKKANPAPYYYAMVLALLLAIRAWNWSRRRVARPMFVAAFAAAPRNALEAPLFRRHGRGPRSA